MTAPVIQFDEGEFPRPDRLLPLLLALAAGSGQGINWRGRRGGRGLRPHQLIAIEALGALCDASVTGAVLGAHELRFEPRRPPRAVDLKIDHDRGAWGPTPVPVTPLLEALIGPLALAEGQSLIQLDGVNAAPGSPSAYWLREILCPALEALGIHAAVEIERWGWYPDGGGRCTLLVDGGTAADSGADEFVLEERGDVVGLWGELLQDPRAREGAGDGLWSTVQRELAVEPLPPASLESSRVGSGGPGIGLFLTLACEHVTCGFEAIGRGRNADRSLATGLTAELIQFFWSDRALEPELARALIVPTVLAGPRLEVTSSAAPPLTHEVASVAARITGRGVTVESLSGGVRIAIERKSE